MVEHRWLIPFFLAVSSILAIVANSLLLLVFFKRRGLRTVSNRLVINLLITNLLSSIVLIPLLLINEINLNKKEDVYYKKVTETEEVLEINFVNFEKDNDFLCYFSQVVTNLVCVASIFGILLIAFDQYFAVIHPLRYHTFINKSKSIVLLVSIWTFSFIVSFLNLLVFEFNFWKTCPHHQTNKKTNLELNIKSLEIIFAYLYFLLIIFTPFIIICSVYYKIYFAAHQNSERMRKSHFNSNYNSNCNSNQLSYNSNQSSFNSNQSNYNSNQSNYNLNQSNQDSNYNSNKNSNYNSNQSNYNSNQSNYNSNQSNYNSNQSNYNLNQPNLNSNQDSKYNSNKSNQNSNYNSNQESNYNSNLICNQPNHNSNQNSYNNTKNQLIIKNVSKDEKNNIPRVHSAPNITNVPTLPTKITRSISDRVNTNIIITLKAKISNASVFKYREETRTAKISILVIFMVLICYFPYGTTIIVNTHLKNTGENYFFNFVSIVLLVFSNIVSPFLFAYRSKRVRRELVKLLLLNFGKNSRGKNGMVRKEFEPFLKGNEMGNECAIPKVVVTGLNKELNEGYNGGILKRVCSKSWTGYKKKCNFISVPDSCLEARCSFSSASTQISSAEE